jgi:hypothetical protein
MPLTRGRDEFVSTTEGVVFLMDDGFAEVACRATSEMLRTAFGSRGDNEDADAEAFRANRETIEQAASAKYEAGRIETDSDVMIIVTGADLPSPLSQKI